ncbi:DUF1018 domain-containing protein [Uruburuella testudinis]|uniref:DUF1018 domain-containing protein n=1 Tax=Uruburuella testudinis TaxID=1282863 RepID=A0ABY4DRE4_9NEIS|nr:phage protein GemA/Gp16 family protein [Uruburuella testudinis]UOO81187.1 DUF1018 domain-containing protein [Uruburuella testudinis]
MNLKERRRKLIAKIKIGQKQLGLDDATYRALLLRVAGQDSCTKLGVLGLEKVLAELTAKGFAPAAKGGAVPKRRQSADAMLRKVEALLAELGYHWNYAHAMARGMFKVDRVEWLNDAHLHKLVAALQIHANRKKREAGHG